MKKLKKIVKQLNNIDNKAILIVLTGIGSVLIFLAAYSWRFNLGGDAIAYISIAEYYAKGSFDLALNAYWSPLVSWLMSVYILFGVEGRLAFMFVNASAASLALGISIYLAQRYNKYSILSSLLIFTTSVPFYLINIRVMNPDMLVVAWVMVFCVGLIYANRLLDNGTNQDLRRAGVLIGLLAASAYFTKAFLVPLFIVVTGTWYLIRVFTEWKINKQSLSKSNILHFLKPIFIAVGALILVSITWILALSIKYGELTINTSFEVNILRRFDEKVDLSNLNVQPLSEPPHQQAVIWGEDPAPPEDRPQNKTQELVDSSSSNNIEEVDIQKNTREDVKSKSINSAIKEYTVSRLQAFPYYINRINSLSPFIFPIMFTTVVLLFSNVVTFKKRPDIVIISIAWFTYFIGYAGINLAEKGGGNLRYYWPMFVLALTILGMILPILIKITRKIASWKKLVLVALIATIPLVSISQYVFGLSYPYSIPVTTEKTLSVSKRQQPRIIVSPQKYKIEKFAEVVEGKNLVKIGDDILSNHAIQGRLAAFHWDAQYYGRKDAGYQLENEKVRNALEYYDIEYFIHFASKSDPLPELAKYGFKVLFSYDLGSTICNDYSIGKEECVAYIIDVDEVSPEHAL